MTRDDIPQIIRNVRTWHATAPQNSSPAHQYLMLCDEIEALQCRIAHMEADAEQCIAYISFEAEERGARWGSDATLAAILEWVGDVPLHLDIPTICFEARSKAENK